MEQRRPEPARTPLPAGAWRGGRRLAGLVAAALACSLCAAACAGGPWTLASPDARREIRVTLTADGSLSYDVRSAGATVLASSPLGLRCDDADFATGLVFDRADGPETRREVYDLVGGGTPHVDRPLAFRTLVLRTAGGARLALDLAASDQGVAFRYRFPDPAAGRRAVFEERTGFSVTAGARGWLQPYHAASRYAPAYEDFYVAAAPGEPPPVSRGQPRGWCLPEAVRAVLRDAPAAWTESRCLLGDPGRSVVVARRTGTTWFVAGLIGLDEPLDIRLDLAPLGERGRGLQISEGPGPLADFAVAELGPAPEWTAQVPARGGFVLRFGP